MGRVARVLERLGLLPQVPGENVYHAFISYSHAADGKLAPALQKGLQRFAKPWYRPRALRVFRDEASLSANPHLWHAIEQALSTSQFFILLASPDAATSAWVGREAEHWRRTKRADNLLIGLTDGELVWDEQTGDFSGHERPVLPETLRGAFPAEPRFIDLRWAHGQDDLSLRNPRFRDAVAELAAPLHGMPKDELAGEDVRQHRRAVRIARTVAGVLVALTAAAVVAGLLAIQQRDEAQRQLRIAQSRQLAAQALVDFPAHLDRGLLLSLEANDITRTAEARDSLVEGVEQSAGVLGFLTGSRSPVIDVAFSPDGRTLATVGDDGTVTLWSVHSRTRRGVPLAGHRVTEVAFRPHGTAFATAAADGTVRIWDVATHRLLAVLRGHTAAVSSIAFSPDGGMLASAGSVLDATVRLWSVATGRQLGQPFPGLAEAVGVSDVAFSPDGKTLAASAWNLSGGWVTLWDVAGRRQLGTSLPIPGGRVLSIAFSPSGAMLAASGDGSTVTLWNVADHTEIGAPLSGQGGPIWSVAFGRDGTLASASSDRTIVLRDVTRTHLGDALPGSVSAETVAFSPEGSTLASGGVDGRVTLWDAASRRSIDVISGFDSSVERVAFGSEGRILDIATAHGEMVLWDIARHRALGQPFRTEAAFHYVAAFSSDGRLFATAADSGAVSIWDLADRSRLGRPIAGELPSCLAFSPDGTKLAAGYVGGEIKVWSVATRQPLATAMHADAEVDSLVFSPDGSTLATGDINGEIMLWNVAHQHRIGAPLRGQNADIGSLVFSADGKTLLSGDANGIVVLWDVAAHGPLGSPLGNNGGEGITAVAVDAAGGIVAGASFQHEIVLWDPLPLGSDLAAVRDRLCSVATRNLTRDEWRDFLPGRAYEKTCPDYPAGT